MRVDDKRGISTVVATVLIVLITVAAVTILWVAISPLIDQNLETGTRCFNVQGKIAIDSDVRYTCYNSTADEETSWNVTHYRVERRAGTPTLEGFEVYVEKNGATLNVTRVVGERNIPIENGNKKYNITTTSFFDIKDDDVLRIAIAPMVDVDGVATSCGVGSYIELSKCS
jgi:hypothetical protein